MNFKTIGSGALLTLLTSFILYGQGRVRNSMPVGRLHYFGDTADYAEPGLFTTRNVGYGVLKFIFNYSAQRKKE